MNEVTCKISDAEWQVMKVLWAESPITATQVIEYLKPETHWSPKTIHTLIGRLVKKQVLGVNKNSNLFQYYPLVSKDDCMRDETKSFLHKVYDGSLHLLLANFVKNESLSPRDIEELRNLLDERIK
ncbi:MULTISPECIES: BlaI/MecI/CopY family transcriptional regulator [unclassified Desulfosporosinus]|uniref:BlaI/MecI/CopY family transcriptional regulator n=1 Tax=unclassified Desulfosporosinus TaxID=2633794 RepID=UPI000223A33A|nr:MULTISPECIES: BlaI/MecI/CopY family transcriptional regulator [unclassified Desulfosporosinus]EGW37226.1 penicillinase repressor [Desulfosporosinus sp. OT]ODA42860.1 Beta-lactamase repressor BlaI [Desulfosporosinus sp. BG]